MAQQLEETNTRAVQAYNLAAQAFAAVIPPQGGSNIDVTLVSGPAYEIAVKNPMDEDVVINADLTVNGDIYQNGSAYESHAEQLYTTKDTVIMRDGATTGLAPGDVAGLIMKLYDGVNDGALVVSNDGTARVGDVGSEQPLLTRDESGSMINGELLQWNGTGQKAVCSGVNLSQIVRGSGNIGSDTKPVKIVGGVATAIGTDVILSGGSSSYKWILKSGSASMRFQSNAQNSVTINVGVTVADPNLMFPMVTLGYDGSAWGTIALNVASKSTTGFTVHSWIPNASGTDVTGNIFWMALVPVAP